MQRQYKSQVISFTNAAANTAVVDVSQYAGGTVLVPSGSSITTLTVYGHSNSNETPVALYDKDGVAVSMTVEASRIYELPTATFGLRQLALVGNASGSVVLALKT